MRIRTYLYYAVLGILMYPIGLYAQDKEPVYKSQKNNDVRFRTGFEVEKKLPFRLSVVWKEELRIKDNFSELDRIYSDISVSFKALDWLKLSAGYTLITVDQEGKAADNYENYWDIRHRLTLSSTFIYETKTNWIFSLKERFQATFLTEDNLDEREKSNPKWVLKSRAMAEYKFRNIPLTPYTYVELCNTLNAPELIDGEYMEKVRTAIGLKYHINKQNSINFYYRFDYNLDKKLDVERTSGQLLSITKAKEYNNIFNISYNYKF